MTKKYSRNLMKKYRVSDDSFPHAWMYLKYICRHAEAKIFLHEDLAAVQSSEHRL